MEEIIKGEQGIHATSRLFRRFVIAVIILCLLAGTAVMLFLGIHYVGNGLTEQNGRDCLPLIGFSYSVAFVGAEYIGITLLVMMLTLETDPFVKRNVIRLRAMGIVALCMGAAILLMLFAPFNAWIFLIGGVLIGLCGLLSLVMAELFNRAVAYKQENDLTV